MTTRKQLEDAIKALVSLNEKQPLNPQAIRLNPGGLRLGTVTVVPPDWTIPQEAWAWPDELKTVCKEIGKPSDEIDTIEVVDDRVKIAGVTLDAVTKDDAKQAEGCPIIASDHPQYVTETVLDVAAAASRDDMRPVLTCVSFDDFAITATDSYRLFQSLSGGQPRGESINVPAKALKAIGALKPGSLRIGYHDMRHAAVAFTTKSGVEVRATIPTVDGQFPKYAQLFPDTWDIRAELAVDNSATTDPVAAAQKVARWCRQNRPALLTFNGRCEISTVPSNTRQVDPMPFTLPTQTRKNQDGEPIAILPVKIGVNPDFFADALKFTGENAQLFAISATRPVMLSNGVRRALTMPIRLND